MTAESIRALLAEQARQEAALQRMLRTVVRWSGVISEAEAGLTEMAGGPDDRASAAGPDSGGWQAGLPELGRHGSTPVSETARQSAPAETGSQRRATKGGQRRSEDVRKPPARTSESESGSTERPTLVRGTGPAPRSEPAHGAWTPGPGPRTDNSAPRAAIAPRVRLSKIAQRDRRAAHGAVAPAPIAESRAGDLGAGDLGARDSGRSSPGTLTTSSRSIAPSIAAQAPEPITRIRPESRAVQGMVSPSPTESAVLPGLPSWQREDRAAPAGFPEGAVRGRRVTWSESAPGPLAPTVPRPKASPVEGPRHRWRPDGSAVDHGWLAQPGMEDPFAGSALEEAMADMLEHAARESGIDVT